MSNIKSTANNKIWLDVFLTALAPAIWGSTYIVTTEFLPPDRPFTAALIRTLPAGILLVLLMRQNPKSNQWIRLIILSALNIGLFQAFLFVAAYRLPGGLAAVVGAIQPLMVMALAWALDHYRPRRLALWASIMGIFGMAALLLSPGSTWDGIGMVAALVGAASMAAGTYFSRRWRNCDLPVFAFTGWQLLIGGLILAPVAIMVDPPLPSLNLTQILAYAYLSIFGALFAYALWFRGIKRLPSVAVSSLGLLSPLMAVILGWVLLNQSMSGLSFLGLIMVLGSILAVQWSSSRRS